MNEIVIEIPVVTPMLNEYVRWHWSKQRKHTKQIAQELWVSMAKQPGVLSQAPIKKCLVVLERHSSGAARIDWDGIFGGCKGLLDALTATHKHGLSIIDDDSTDCIVACPTIIPVQCKKGNEKMVIRIIPVTDEL